MSSMTLRLTLATTAMILALPAPRAAATDNPEVLLYPADHPANAAAPQPEGETPEWMTRVVARPSMLPYLLEPSASQSKGRPACVLCPGGGYGGLSMDKEGVEPARWLNERGVVAFVLRYRCGGGKNKQPVPLEDAQRAIRTVRAHAKDWDVDPERVGIWGFSAGGHLAATAGVFNDGGDPTAADSIDRQSSRPDFLVLIYPVVSMKPGTTHGGSLANLLGPDPSDELVAKWSADGQVNERTPPTFLVHASDDGAVVPENSLLFYRALVAHKIPAELHLYERGGHGFGMLRGDRPADRWPTLLEPWLRERGVLDR
ncbi:MAG: alpha/beta hydrolase [Pirellulales bacterium]|nr:alpha/beta hydrolase [Pirellulales bacterium]